MASEQIMLVYIKYKVTTQTPAKMIMKLYFSTLFETVSRHSNILFSYKTF